jgi:hypothetical protein
MVEPRESPNVVFALFYEGNVCLAWIKQENGCWHVTFATTRV